MWLGLNHGKSTSLRASSDTAESTGAAIGSRASPRLRSMRGARGGPSATATSERSFTASRGGEAAVAHAPTEPMMHTKPRQRHAARRVPCMMMSKDVGEAATTDAAPSKVRCLREAVEPSAHERIRARRHEHFRYRSERSASRRHEGTERPRSMCFSAPAPTCRGMSRRSGASFPRHRRWNTCPRTMGGPAFGVLPRGDPRSRSGMRLQAARKRRWPVRGSSAKVENRPKTASNFDGSAAVQHFCSGSTRDVCYYAPPPSSRSPRFFGQARFIGRMRTSE